MSDDEVHEYFMGIAVQQALLAKQKGEVPVGAVVVKHNEIIGQGHNQCITQHDPSLHAEMVAIRQASLTLSNYRLPDTTLYVTLEPCAMCAGLIIHSRIKTLVFATSDSKTGAAGSVINVLEHDKFNHNVELKQGYLGKECSHMLSSFFKERRAQKKLQKRKQND